MSRGGRELLLACGVPGLGCGFMQTLECSPGLQPRRNGEDLFESAVPGSRTVFRLRNRFSTVPIFSLHCNTANSPSGLGQAVLRPFRFERNRERKGAYSPPEPFRAPPRRSFPRAPGDDGNLQMESGASAPVGTRTFGLMRRFPGDADGFPAQEPLFDGSVFLAPLQHRGFGLWVSGLGQAVLRPFRFERNRERKGG